MMMMMMMNFNLLESAPMMDFDPPGVGGVGGGAGGVSTGFVSVTTRGSGR